MAQDRKLEEPVTYPYVRNFLNSRFHAKQPLFERGRWGIYRLHPTPDLSLLWRLPAEPAPTHQRS